MLRVAKCKSSSKDQKSNNKPLNIGMICAISSIWKLFFMHLGSVELIGLQTNIFYWKTIWWNSLDSLMKYYCWPTIYKPTLNKANQTPQLNNKLPLNKAIFFGPKPRFAQMGLKKMSMLDLKWLSCTNHIAGSLDLTLITSNFQK